MEAFSALLALCEGNPPVTGGLPPPPPPPPSPVTRSFAVFFDLRLNKRLVKQSKRSWFETLSRSLWRLSNVKIIQHTWGELTVAWWRFVTLRPRLNGRHFADDTFKRIFMYENVGISINISLKFVPKGLINNIPALVQIMAWRRPGDKPLSEPMMVNLLTHICVTRPQWVIRSLFMAIEIWVNIGSDVDLLPTSTKPLREVEKFGLELLAIMIVSAQQH